MIELSRRKLLCGLGALIAAPAVVRASSLMPVSGIVLPATAFKCGHLGTSYHAHHIYDLLLLPSERHFYSGYIGEWHGVRIVEREMTPTCPT